MRKGNPGRPSNLMPRKRAIELKPNEENYLPLPGTYALIDKTSQLTQRVREAITFPPGF